MALVKCIECGTEVSDKAEKCPKCAYPISAKDNEVMTQVIEQTSKKLKKQLLIGVVVLVFGFIFLFSGFLIGAIVFLLLGLIVIIQTRISIWWHHQ